MECTGSRSPLFEMKHCVIGGALALLTLAAFAGSEERGIPGGVRTQETDGETLVEENCLFCHDDSYIVSMNLPREQWEEVLVMMLGMGMPPLEPEVEEQILDYLEENHGPRDSSGGPGGAAAAQASDSGDDLPWAYPRYRPNPLFWRER